jgi:hypothetical protein
VRRHGSLARLNKTVGAVATALWAVSSNMNGVPGWPATQAVGYNICEIASALQSSHDSGWLPDQGNEVRGCWTHDGNIERIDTASGIDVLKLGRHTKSTKVTTAL